MRRGVVPVGAAVLLALAGCGDRTAIPWDGQNPPAQHAVAAVGGNAQMAPAGLALPAPLEVEVRDLDGNLTPGVELTWQTDAGVLSPDGWQAGLTLDDVARTHTVTVSVTGDPAASVKLTAAGYPSMLSLSPAVAVAGMKVTLYGVGLSDTLQENAVTIGTETMPIIAMDVGELTFDAPGIDDSADAGVIVNGIPSPDALEFAPFRDRSPAAIPGTANCSLFQSGTSRNVAIGPELTLYVAGECPGGGGVLVSTDGGLTFPTLSMLANNTNHIAVQATDVPGVVFSAWIDGNAVMAAVSTDFGTTFTPPVQVASGHDRVSLAYDATNIYVGAWDVQGAGSWTVAASPDLGQTWPTNTAFNMDTAYGDLVVDHSTGVLYAVSDTPGFHLRASVDGGQSFGAEDNPSGSLFFSDWTACSGFMFGIGDNDMRVIDLTDLSSSSVSGEDNAGGASNAVACDRTGNAYIVADSGSVTVQRLPAGTTTAEAAIEVDPQGTNPSVVVGAFGAVAVAYEQGGDVKFATVVFPAN